MAGFDRRVKTCRTRSSSFLDILHREHESFEQDESRQTLKEVFRGMRGLEMGGASSVVVTCPVFDS